MKKPTLIPQEIFDKLIRIQQIDRLIDSDERNILNDKLMNERSFIQDEMVELFMPVIDLLTRSKMITMWLDLNFENKEEFESSFGDPINVFKNGNIWIECEHSGGGAIQQSSDISSNKNNKEIN
jgi:hypothetical protein